MSFWSTATVEQKLAQIDAGIELGMATAVVAKNLGCHRHTLYFFARQHGRRFPAGTCGLRTVNNGAAYIDFERVSRIRARSEEAKQAYFSGEQVDMWRAR